MPDFDVDFCMEGRDRVIEYVAERYGREKVSQIITYGSMAAKAVVRDVGRVLGHPYGFVDRIAKLIPFEIGMTLDKALEQEEALRESYENDEEAADPHRPGAEAGGPGAQRRQACRRRGHRALEAHRLHAAVLRSRAAGASCQFDKDDVEAVGLVKFDFLGLRTLTIIDWALQTINASVPVVASRRWTSPPSRWMTPTFDLLKRCETTAVFQLESRGMKDLIKRLQPDILRGHHRPGGPVPPRPAAVGHGGRLHQPQAWPRRRSSIPIPRPEAILEPTYGVILYQEQVMQIAQVLAGYSLGPPTCCAAPWARRNPRKWPSSARSSWRLRAARGGPDTAPTSST
jgi:DNA polymerase III subunit alpha